MQQNAPQLHIRDTLMQSPLNMQPLVHADALGQAATWTLKTVCLQQQGHGAQLKELLLSLKLATEAMAGWALKDCVDGRWWLTTELATQQLSTQEWVRP